MPFITQTRFPRLWLLLQNLAGGSIDKRRMALEHYRNEKRVLEVGCSAGNVSDAFRRIPGISYTGVDIDDAALAVARRRFADCPHFRFLNLPLSYLASNETERYDYILLAGILHHVDDETSIALIRTSLSLLVRGGRLVVSEPEALAASDGLLMELFYRLEQGKYLRSRAAYEDLIQKAGGDVAFSESRPVHPSAIPWPTVARFSLIECRPAQQAVPSES